MDIQAVVFDVNGTLVRIRTDDGMDQIFRAAAHFLTYQGIDLTRNHVRDLYFRTLEEQQRASPEAYPEFDAVAIWRRIVDEHATAFTLTLPVEKLEQMPRFLAEMSRGIARRRLRLYPHVREVLDVLRERYPLALVSDAQSAHAYGELHKLDLLRYFDPIVVSGDYGYRKPDPRLFRLALTRLGVPPANAVYVGNDMYRDVFGARRVGMRTVLFESEHGRKSHPDTAPDHTITDMRDLLEILDVRAAGATP